MSVTRHAVIAERHVRGTFDIDAGCVGAVLVELARAPGMLARKLYAGGTLYAGQIRDGHLPDPLYHGPVGR